MSITQAAQLMDRIDNLEALLDAYKAHHAHFHADCNIEGPVALPDPAAYQLPDRPGLCPSPEDRP